MANNRKIVDVEYAKALRKKLDSKYATKGELSVLKDKVFDVIARTYEEDIPTDSYVVPSNFDGHGLIDSVPCEVKSISGASKQFNQLVQNGNFVDSSNWSVFGGTLSVSNNVATLTITSVGSANRFQQDLTPIANHKYLIRFDIKTSVVSKGFIHFGNDYNSNTFDIGTTWGTKTFLLTPTQTTNPFRLYFNYGGNYLSNGDTINLRNVNIFDLNLMGLDSITSVDEFKAKYPLDYYGYDSGSIKSVSVSKIESYKQYASVDLGTINWSSITTNGGVLKFYGNLENAKKLTTNLVCNKLVAIDSYKQFTNTIDIVGDTISIDNATPTRVGVVLKDQTITDTTAFKTAMSGVILYYEPNIPTNAPLLGTINLPNGKIDLNGINSVKDTLTFEEQENGTYNAVLTRRVGVVDMGSWNWTYNSGALRFIHEGLSSSISKPSSDGVKGNIICSLYKTDTWGNSYSSSGPDNVVFENTSGYISIRDTRYTDSATFKTAMSGIPLYYELATPTTEVIATGLTREQVAMAFEIGGTIINDNENTDYDVQTTTTIDFACKDWSI